MAERRHTFSATSTGASAPAELRRALGDEPLAGVMVFGAPEVLRGPGVATTLRDLFPDTPVVGCTTAGELGSDGYRVGTLTAVAFCKDAYTVAAAKLEDLAHFDLGRARQALSSIENQLQQAGRTLDPQHCFAVLLADGLSLAEEKLAYLLQGVLGQVSLFGGSAGDGMRFQSTEVLFEGALHSNSAVLIVVSTDRPFTMLRTQHFTPSPTKLVVTGARAADRIVTEFNGLPAAEEYARGLGVPVSALNPTVFAQHPLLIRMGGNWYVRSIQKANPDGSLSIFCAIDEGLVLTLGTGGVGLVDDLRTSLEQSRSAIGPAELVLGCDCILRRIEAETTGLVAPLQALFEEFNVVGFNTYGEQVGAVHVNQTFTGVALG